MTLPPQGNDLLEAQLATIASFKLVERPNHVFGDEETDVRSFPEAAESQAQPANSDTFLANAVA